MYTKLKRMLKKEENITALLYSFAVLVVFLLAVFKMNDYETQKAIIEDVEAGLWEDNVSYDEINRVIIGLCEKTSNEQQCLRDFLR